MKLRRHGHYLRKKGGDGRTTDVDWDNWGALPTWCSITLSTSLNSYVMFKRRIVS